MRKILIFLICFSNYTVIAQKWEWAYHVNSNSGSSIEAVQTDSAGNPYFMGRSSDSTVFYGQNGTFSEVGLRTFVAKYNVSGNINWIGGGWGSNPYAYSMSIDKHSNCFLTGDFGGTAYFGIGGDTLKRNANNLDYFLVKLDKNGKAVFFNSEGGICQDLGTSVTTLSNDELIVFWIDATFCDHGGDWIYHFNKLSPNGTQIWSLKSPGLPYVIFDRNNISTTTDGGFLLSGTWHSHSICFEAMTDTVCLATPVPSSDTDVFLAKYSLSGDVQWSKSIRGNNYQHERFITTDRSNNILLAIEGHDITYYDSIMLLSKCNNNLYIIKTDEFGNLINYISFPTPSDTWHFLIKDLKTDIQGNIYLLASTDTTLYIGKDSILFNLQPNQSAFVLIKLDPNLNYLWSQYALQNNNYYLNWRGALAVTDSNVYLGVNYNAPVFLNGSNYQFPAPKNPTTFDSFFAAIKNNSGLTSIAEMMESSVNIFPNPTTGTFSINLKNHTLDTKIYVYNVLGSCVLKKISIKKGNQEIDLSDQAKGIYFMEIVSGNERIVKKIILQ